MLVKTDLLTTRQSARRIAFEPSAPITATDVQEAIEQVAALPTPISPTTVNAAASPYAVGVQTTLLWVDTTGGAVELDLPAGALRGGLALQIKDINGNANVNNITIDPFAGETIDGLDPLLIDVDYGGYTLYPKPAGGWTTQP